MVFMQLKISFLVPTPTSTWIENKNTLLSTAKLVEFCYVVMPYFLGPSTLFFIPPIFVKQVLLFCSIMLLFPFCRKMVGIPLWKTQLWVFTGI